MGLFGDISRTLFGGSKSDNKAYGQINEQFSPWVEQGGAGLGAASAIMGLGGPEARSEALNDWWGSSGGDFLLNKGMDDVDAFMRAKGLSTSGAAMKGLEDYRSGLASTKMGEAMNNLMGISRLGLGAGGLQVSAGQNNESNGGGLGTVLGALLASDPRLKTNITKIGELEDGLGIYDYDYRDVDGPIAAFMPEGRQRGVMADEVSKLRPWALGPEIGGFQTVNYGAL